MSSCNERYERPEDRLGRKHRIFHLVSGTVTFILAIGLALAAFFACHRHLWEHPSEVVFIFLLAVFLLAMIAVNAVFDRGVDRQYAAAMRALRQLTDDIAHDLRTPLTRLSAEAELVATGNAKAEDLVATVGIESQNLLHLVNTTLDIARMERGLERTPSEPIDLASTIRSVAELYHPILEERDLHLKMSIERTPPVSGHAVRLCQVMQNLLDNAIKFTPDGGDITVSLRKDDGDAVICVSDTGPGVPETDRKKIFDRFYRGDGTRTKPGNGLGLALVSAIVTSYGGTVSCGSAAIGGGACFTVKLPIGR